MKRIDPTPYPSDKVHHAKYFALYEEVFAPLADRDIDLLELGVKAGGSLEMWRDYFPRGRITGLDIREPANPRLAGDQRVKIYRGLQDDLPLLDRIAAERAPGGFDVIIDDCAHVGEVARRSFWHLFPRHLKPGGLYVLEDWGTGYWRDWPDGSRYHAPKGDSARRAALLSTAERRLHESRAEDHPSLGGRVARTLLKRWVALLRARRFPSHDHGMVGFVKELVDQCALEDILKDTGAPMVASPIARLQIAHGQVVVFKTPANPG